METTVQNTGPTIAPFLVSPPFNDLQQRSDCIKEREERLLELNRMLQPWQRIVIEFSTPVSFVIRGRSVEVERVKIAGVFESKTGGLCYAMRKGYRRGFPFGTALVWAKRIELAKPPVNEFPDFITFLSKFDLRFISREFVESLWKSGNTSMGRPWHKKDFRRMTPKWKEAMRLFLRDFVDVNTKTPGHIISQYSPKGTLSVDLETSRHSGRDVKISHSVGRGCVDLASEFMGCANGEYLLVASVEEALYLERD